MKIAIIADPELPVPPILYGGIERIIDMLIKGLIEEGHQVTLFAHEDSITPANLYVYKGKTSGNIISTIKNTWLINRVLASDNYDLIHSFGRLAYLIPQLPLKTLKVMSYQREPTISQIKRAVLLSRRNSLAFTGCSNYISNQIGPYAPSYTIYNGVDTNTYDFKSSVTDDAPLIFLGRLEPIKGAHVAIQVAIQASKKLVIAGNIVPEFEPYFDAEIKPFLNNDIQYVGAVNDCQKNELLGKSAALLMPIEWDEPFGIVMIEAMACGTPVIAFNKGAVPEVVTPGLNGFICENIDEMVTYVASISKLKRQDIRQEIETRFSANIILNNYLDLYRELLNNGKGINQNP